MIKCDKVVLELALYRACRQAGLPAPLGRQAGLKGDISPELKTEIDAHLNGCVSCQKEFKTLGKLDEILNHYQVAPVSGSFRVRFQKRLWVDAKRHPAVAGEEETRVSEYWHRFHFNLPEWLPARTTLSGWGQAGWRKVGVLASAAVVLLTVVLWVLNPFNTSVNHTENEMINNLELLENMETVEVMDIINDYEVVDAVPEIMEVDLNWE